MMDQRWNYGHDRHAEATGSEFFDCSKPSRRPGMVINISPCTIIAVIFVHAALTLGGVFNQRRSLHCHFYYILYAIYEQIILFPAQSDATTASLF